MKTDYSVVFSPENYVYYICPDCGNIAKIIPQSRYLEFQLSASGVEFDPNPAVDIDYRLRCTSCIDDKDNQSFMFKCDRKLAIPISDLIKKGYKTLFCCEGHFYENGEISVPYVTFVDDEDRTIYKKLKQTLADNNIEEDIYFIDKAVKEFKTVLSGHKYTEKSIETSVYINILGNPSTVGGFELYKNKFFNFIYYISRTWEPKNR